MFFCPKCFNNSKALNTHLAFCHFKKDLLQTNGSSLSQCGFCGKLFPDKNKTSMEYSITFHLSQHGFLRELIPQQQYQEMFVTKPRLKCFLCSNILMNVKSLQRHLTQYHFLNKLYAMSGSSSHKCGICGKCFFKPDRPKYRVENVMGIHLGLKHGLLKQILSQFCKAEPQKQSAVKRDILEVNVQEKKKSKIDLPMVEEAAEEEGKQENVFGGIKIWSSFATLASNITEESQ